MKLWTAEGCSKGLCAGVPVCFYAPKFKTMHKASKTCIKKD